MRNSTAKGAYVKCEVIIIDISMKNKFFEQYKLSDEEVKSIWDNGTLVIDTNVLLNLYRYNEATCDDILDYMKTFDQRLWMPYQVGWEYHNNRMSTAYDAQNATDDIYDLLKDFSKKLEEKLNKYNHHPYISKKEVLKRFDRYVGLLKGYLDNLKAGGKDYFHEDTIFDKLSELYDGLVGDDFSEDELKKLYKDGQERYKIKMPPGYKDDTPAKRAMGDRHVYGDLIVWKQTIKHAKDKGVDVIFVSDDLKEDWIIEFHGHKRFGPRKELLKEFHDGTNGKKILIYSQSDFLKYANEHYNVIKEDTMEDVQRAHQNLLDYYQNQILPNTRQPAFNTLDSSLWGSVQNPNAMLTTPASSWAAFEAQKKYRDLMQIAENPFAPILEQMESLTKSVPGGWVTDPNTGLSYPVGMVGKTAKQSISRPTDSDVEE